jgi:hypothetical protein
MFRRIASIAVGAVAAAALTVGPAYAFSPNEQGQSAPGIEHAGPNCEKTLNRQKSNPKSHQGYGDGLPSNCDHYFNPQNR